MNELSIPDLDSEIIGFDLGHGETALSVAAVASITEPQVLEVQSKRSFITAVAVHPKRGVIIGEDAYTARNLESLKVRFKSSRLERPEVREPIRLFVGKVLETLRSRKLIRGGGKSHFIVGCPSGWTPQIRAEYENLMRESGLDSVTLISESRAAFIHAKESSDLQISTEYFQSSVLIVDVGSSTTDFTAVHHLHERYIDFGDTALGAGLIDRAIFDWVVARHEERGELEKVFRDYPQYEAMCELKCRTVKEAYFSNETRWAEEPVSDALKIPSRPPLFFEVELARREMQEILSTPVLEGRNWLDAYREALASAKRQMRDALPELVFLTGGASRMDFIYEITQEIFPQARVVRGREPELSIAKGLAWAGRIDRKTRLFREEVEALFQSSAFDALIKREIPKLLRRVAAALVRELPEQVILPAFHEWRRGQIKTLDGLEPVVESRTETWLNSREGKACIAAEVKQWFERLGEEIEVLVNPLCDKYQIPRTAFNLSSDGDWRGKVPVGLVAGADQLWGYRELEIVIGIVVSTLIASLAGGSGMALIMHGPLGLLIGLIAGLVVFAAGRHLAEDWVKKSDLHPWIRKLAGEKRLREKILENREVLENRLVESLEQNAETLAKLTNDVRDSVRGQLNQSVEAVVLLIR